MELGGICDRQVRRRIQLLDSLGWIYVRRGAKEKTQRALSVSQGGQKVLPLKWEELPEIVRAGRTKGPERADNTSARADKRSTNLEINIDLDDREALLKEAGVNDDGARRTKELRGDDFQKQRPGFPGNTQADQRYPGRDQNNGSEMDGMAWGQRAPTDTRNDQSGSGASTETRSNSSGSGIDWGPMIRAMHADPHFGPIIRAREERERREAAGVA